MDDNTKRLSVLVTPELLARCHRAAGERQLSVADLVRRLLTRSLDTLDPADRLDEAKPEPE